MNDKCTNPQPSENKNDFYRCGKCKGCRMKDKEKLPRRVFIKDIPEAFEAWICKKDSITSGLMEDPKTEYISLQESDHLIREARASVSRLEEQVRVAKGALEFYADKKSYSLDYDTSAMVSRRVILYSDQYEVNDETIFAGRRAIEALNVLKSQTQQTESKYEKETKGS